MSPDATGRHSVRFPHCISFCYFQATKGGLLNTGVSFKGAVGCGKDHPRPRVSPNVALAAPCQAKWDGIFPFVSGGGSQETAWGSVCKLSRVTTGVLLHRCLRHLGRQVRAPSSTNQRQGAGRGFSCPHPAAGLRAAAGFRGRGCCGCGGDKPPLPRAPGGLSATAEPRAWTPPGRSPAHPRPGWAAFPAAGSASPLGHGSRPLVQLSKQGVSLSFWLTKSQRGTGGLNACVWTQAIIPNYSFSFEPARPAGELAAERAP